MGRAGYRLKNRGRLVFMVVLAFTLLAGGGLYAFGFFDEFLYDKGITTEPPETIDAFKGKMNVLALGVDARKGEKMARTDTMMLCSVDTEKNLMTVVSIPRDTRVYIPGHGYDKINSATLLGGPELAMQTVSQLLGIRINKYVMTNFEGFKDIVDALGGVTIDVKQRMYHYDPQDGGIYTIDLRPGVQRLNGEKALQYVRYRSLPQGDIDRTEQQQKFLAALTREVLQPSSVVKLPSLVISISKAVDTNLSLSEMTKLATAAGKMTNANIVAQTLPGRFLNLEGLSYWEVDPSQARLFISGIMEGRTNDKVVLGETVNLGSKVTPGGLGTDEGKVIPPQDKKEDEQENEQKNDTGSKTPSGTSGSVGSGDKKQSGSNTGTVSKTPDSGKTGSPAKPSKDTKASPPSGSMIVPGVPQDTKNTGSSGASVIIEPKSN